MQKAAAIFLSSLPLIMATTDMADARRGGRFVSSFARGMAHGGIGNKAYGPDVLTAQQLTECLKRADRLDDESNSINTDRNLVQANISQVDSLKSELDRSEATLNRYSQNAIDQFNIAVKRYNALVADARSTQAFFNQQVQQQNENIQAYNLACAKRYYADDLEVAKRSIGLE